jgi:hypothetical protein
MINIYDMNKDDKLCLICYEGNKKIEKVVFIEKIIKTTNCNCEYLIHRNCLELWFKGIGKQKCLICHKIIGLKETRRQCLIRYYDKYFKMNTRCLYYLLFFLMCYILIFIKSE